MTFRRAMAAFIGRRLLQDEDDTPTVTFPDDYPNSVRHFLLIGFLGMFIGAIVFFYMGISRKVNTVMHVLTFFVAAVSACAYYAEWAGLGVEYKTTDTTPRVIFWAHYLDWVVTGPLILADLALLSRSDTPTIISLVGNMVLYVICGLIGALTVAPYKYMWWVASLIFLIIVFMLLLQRLNNAEGYGGDALKGLTWLTILFVARVPDCLDRRLGGHGRPRPVAGGGHHHHRRPHRQDRLWLLPARQRGCP